MVNFMREVSFNRCRFFISIGFLLTTVGGSFSAEKVIELKLAHFVPTVHVQHLHSFVPFVKKVEELSGGKVKIKIYPGGSLGNPKTMVDAIKTGITDIGFVIPSYVPGRFNRSGVFELPFLFENAEHLTTVMYDLYEKHFARDYEDFKVLWFLSSPLSQLHTVKKKVVTTDDFKGITIRVGGNEEMIALKKLGANPVAMPISELSISLQKGVVHGAITPYAALKTHKLIEMVKYITEINMSGSLMCVLMNKRKWKSLPDDVKQIIDQASGKEMGMIAAKAFDQEDLENIASAKGKIEIQKLSDAEKKKIRKKITIMYSDWIEKVSKKGIAAKQILDDVRASAKKYEKN